MKRLLSLLFFISITINTQAKDYEYYRILLDTTIKSKHLPFDKQISITVPIEWQKDLDQKYPLIVIFDQQNQRLHNYIINTIDYLTSTGQMPSTIVVSVNSENKYRYKETQYKISNKNGLALENELFLFEELIPFAENEINASKFRMLIGHSRYGYFTTSLLNSRLNEINAVIALDPFVIQKNVDLSDSLLQINNQSKFTKYYRFGCGDGYIKHGMAIDSAFTVNKTINNKGYFFPNADHYATPGLAIGSALYDIFEYWSIQQRIFFDDNEKGLSLIDSLTQNIYNHYGSNLKLSLGVLNGKGWYYYNENKFNKAIEAWEILIVNYPIFSEVYLNIMDAQIQLKLDPKETELKFNKSIKSSKFYSEKEKQELMEWLKELKE